ncbi:helix-turn-helix domain-containing protein [Patescibacteria group bacterium]|nr:helix-turn-helix domain-containing protein [Patescibacteria group bacterium]MBU1702852.1 helix-turn-helix domain-containing protein [Patescibacteria group bacterium]MBU1953394.1 helix-turn-helix domain-containing protein [Patescibacteria group bacterium]
MDKSKKPIQITLGQRIKELRKQSCLTQEELAIRSGVSYTTLTKVENGGIKNPSFESVVAIAKGLSVSLDDLTIKL